MNTQGAGRRLLIHIGYHKTGSTTLQSHMFGGAGSPFEQSPRDRTHLQRAIVRGGPHGWISAEDNAQLDAEIASCNDRGRHFVISHERLSGYFATGGFDSCVIADRLRNTFPDARILIVIREQVSMVLSVYSQYITDGGVLSFRRFLRGLQPLYRRVPAFDLDFYAYDRLIGYYQGLFGAENVLVLLVEMMDADPGEFSARLHAFCGYDAPRASSQGLPVANSRRSALGQEITRQFNRIFWRNQLNPAGLFESPLVALVMRRTSNLMSRLTDNPLLRPVDRHLRRRRRAELEALIGGRFAASNRHVEELTGLDLGRYGYRLTGPDAEKRVLAAKESAETNSPVSSVIRHHTA